MTNTIIVQKLTCTAIGCPGNACSSQIPTISVNNPATPLVTLRLTRLFSMSLPEAMNVLYVGIQVRILTMQPSRTLARVRSPCSCILDTRFLDLSPPLYQPQPERRPSRHAAP